MNPSTPTLMHASNVGKSVTTSELLTQMEGLNMMDEVGPKGTPGDRGEHAPEILGATEEKEFSDFKALLDPKSKKGKKASKKKQRGLTRQVQGMHRQLQAQHIMARLTECRILTPEEKLIKRAEQLAKDELNTILGERQAAAFFRSKPDTLASAFFSAATYDLNPKLMSTEAGTSRTLTEIYEYFIYKHANKLMITTGGQVEFSPGQVESGLDKQVEEASAAPLVPVEVIEIDPEAQLDNPLGLKPEHLAMVDQIATTEELAPAQFPGVEAYVTPSGEVQITRTAEAAVTVANVIGDVRDAVAKEAE
jgi:hypothetical protein